jgi:hypothetical protein
VARAQLGQRAAQARIVEFCLFQRAEQVVQRIDQLAKSFLQFVERAELQPSVDQQMSQRFVVAADALADIGEVDLPLSSGDFTHRTHPNTSHNKY